MLPGYGMMLKMDQPLAMLWVSLKIASGAPPPYRFVMHDRDKIFSRQLDQELKDFGIKVLTIPLRAPQANAYCERSVGSIRRACLDFLVLLNEST